MFGPHTPLRQKRRRVGLIVDGAYLGMSLHAKKSQKGIVPSGAPARFNPARLRTHLESRLGAPFSHLVVHAASDGRHDSGSRRKMLRLQAAGFDVRTRGLKHMDVFCRTKTCTCCHKAGHGTPIKRIVQAGVDVSIAVSILELVHAKEPVHAIVLVAGDGDFLPAVAHARASGVAVYVAGFKGSTSAELRRSAGPGDSQRAGADEAAAAAAAAAKNDASLALPDVPHMLWLDAAALRGTGSRRGTGSASSEGSAEEDDTALRDRHFAAASTVDLHALEEAEHGSKTEGVNGKVEADERLRALLESDPGFACLNVSTRAALDKLIQRPRTPATSPSAKDAKPAPKKRTPPPGLVPLSAYKSTTPAKVLQQQLAKTRGELRLAVQQIQMWQAVSTQAATDATAAARTESQAATEKAAVEHAAILATQRQQFAVAQANFEKKLDKEQAATVKALRSELAAAKAKAAEDVAANFRALRSELAATKTKAAAQEEKWQKTKEEWQQSFRAQEQEWKQVVRGQEQKMEELKAAAEAAKAMQQVHQQRHGAGLAFAGPESAYYSSYAHIPPGGEVTHHSYRGYPLNSDSSYGAGAEFVGAYATTDEGQWGQRSWGQTAQAAAATTTTAAAAAAAAASGTEVGGSSGGGSWGGQQQQAQATRASSASAAGSSLFGPTAEYFSWLAAE